MNTGRIKAALEIIIYGHILNWPWRSGTKRRQVRGEATRKAVLEYLKRYAKLYSNIPPSDNDGEKAAEEERIFTIWLQGEENAPNIVKACFRSIRRNCRQKLTILDSESLKDWIDLPDTIMRKWQEGKIKPAHFTDICRTELLYRHGGIWLDATAFVTSPVPDFIMNEDFFIFMSYGNLSGSYAFIQNCFFRARKGSYLIKAWNTAIQTYWQYEDSTVDYFVHQLLFESVVENNPLARALFDKMPKISQDPTHALWWGYRDKPFNQAVFDEITSGSFFQKTEYKSESASNPVSGSFSDIMQKM